MRLLTPSQSATWAARQAAWVGLAVSGSLILGALAFQFVGGLSPCEMCYWQRYAHLAVIALAGVGLWLGKRGVSWLVVLALLVSAGLGLYHAGVELKWWAGATACSSGFTAGVSVEDMFATMLDKPLTRCDQVPWSLLGLSMAGWNALISFGGALCAGAVLLFTRRSRNG